jgi:hypothetical protein
MSAQRASDRSVRYGRRGGVIRSAIPDHDPQWWDEWTRKSIMSIRNHPGKG